MKKLNILLEPSFQSTRDSMGYSEDDMYNEEAVMFQQGFNIEVLEVAPNTKFRISEDFKGEINCEETQYKFVKHKYEWDDDFVTFDEDFYQIGEPIYLDPGHYHFLDDGLTIKELPQLF